MTKKLLACVFVLLLVFSISACKGEHTITTEDSGIVYCPWNVDAVALAKEAGQIHYYFMASYGRVKSENENHPYKWGDACLIVFPDGRTMLVDGGVEAYGPVLVENLKWLGVKKLDYVVMSHSHNDHCFGLIKEGGVFENFQVGQIYWTGITCAYWEGTDLEAICADFGYPMQVLRQGDSLQIGQVLVKVLWPAAGLAGTPMEDTAQLNNHSLVMRFDYKNHSALFTGDLYEEAEGLVMDGGGDQLSVDLLKVCHHGSPTSGSYKFLLVVGAELAVATGYQDVTWDMVERYRSVGTELLYDRYHGYIHVSSDGETMTYDTDQSRAKDGK